MRAPLLSLSLSLSAFGLALGVGACATTGDAAGAPSRFTDSEGAPSPYQDRAVKRRVADSAPAAKVPASAAEAELMASADTVAEGAAPGDDSGPDREGYNVIIDNPFVNVADDPRSTFSVDVDTASYANVRRMLMAGYRPPASAVRVEEMINYFSYDYPEPEGEHPFRVDVEVAAAPWQPGHRLLRVGLKGKPIDFSERPPQNLVFLLDVSGSMSAPHKLPLLQKSLALLVDNLDERDRVSIVAYAGASGVVLPPTPGDEGATILSALERLSAGGSTNGSSGIELAYELAARSFLPSGSNRVILATDGDFNVGVSSQGELVRLIEEKARSDIFLSVLGFGMGNYQDGTLEELTGHGNGNYAYIDSLREAEKVLVEEVGGTMLTIAKDVKIQIEFNPQRVGAYRLIGYENRVLEHQDFNDDDKDAGEIGAGHTVTALYEIVPAGNEDEPRVDPLKYQTRRELAPASDSPELATVKLRYQEPHGDSSKLLVLTAADEQRSLGEASPDFRFAAAVAGFGMILRDSPHRGEASLAQVRELAKEGRGDDARGYREEFLELVEKAERVF